MRFDDMIATILAQPTDRADRVAAQWRQLVDLLAQRRPAREDPLVDRAFDCLREQRSRVDMATRRDVARSLAGLPVDPRLLAFFAEDAPSIAAPLIAEARLESGEWLSLLPKLGPSARALLRHRRDLPVAVEQALATFGAADFLIEPGPGQVAAPERGAEPVTGGGETQIRELVERIESFRRKQRTRRPEASDEPPPCDHFRWETGPNGLLRWVEGAPRGPLVGQSLAVIAGPGQHGVDGQVAGAFEKRSPFRDARFSVAGKGAVSGDWRLSGVPFFDPARGHFLGYRGTARRPRIDEIAHSDGATGGLFGTRLPAESLRQLLHELRTPLNAIFGFAELIEGQYMGPAALHYREQAAAILDQTRRLLEAIEDLDAAARLEAPSKGRPARPFDASELLARLAGEYRGLAGERGAKLDLEIIPQLIVRADPASAERIFSRLLAAMIGLSASGETIRAELAPAGQGGAPSVRFTIGRPRAIEGLAEADLLDPGYGPDGDWPDAPTLGLGFTLRLVRTLAEAAGGALLVTDHCLSLHLPAASVASPVAEAEKGC